MYNLFVDVKRSTTFLKDYEQEFMFSEVNPDETKSEAAADGDAEMQEAQ